MSDVAADFRGLVGRRIAKISRFGDLLDWEVAGGDWGRPVELQLDGAEAVVIETHHDGESLFLESPPAWLHEQPELPASPDYERVTGRIDSVVLGTNAFGRVVAVELGIGGSTMSLLGDGDEVWLRIDGIPPRSAPSIDPSNVDH